MFNKRLNEERLDALSFLDYLNLMQDYSKNIYYSKGSPDAYWEAREIIQNVIKRYNKESALIKDEHHSKEISHNLQSTQIRLEDFVNFDKADAIATFKSDIESDLHRLIFNLTYSKKESDSII